MIPNTERPGLRRGITLTEILISILIMGIGLISLATLFPIGLLRLREAQRQTRSAYLYESATADANARSLLNSTSFTLADLLNPLYNQGYWYYSANMNGGTGGFYNPLVQDRAAYTLDPFDTTSLGFGASAPSSGGYGLPFAYDPLWRWYTEHASGGIYLYDTNNPNYTTTLGGTPEARFASGVALQASEGNESDGNPISAYGLQRLTNFNRPAYTNTAGTVVGTYMPSANLVPNIFVSPEDFVWQDPTLTNNVYTLGGVVGANAIPVATPASPVVPDLNTPSSLGVPNQDWRFTWMITAKQNNASNGASYDGNIVVFENRPFSLDTVSVGGTTVYQAGGETVVEGIFGYSHNVVSAPGYTVGYGSGADQTVLIRWNGSYQADPLVRVGDFIADVTYERIASLVSTRFMNSGTFTPPQGIPNPLNNGEWDNLPAQRCFWYQVQKITPAQVDPILGSPYRSMVVYVNRKLEARTLLQTSGGKVSPVYRNAVLICPNVVNVIPQTFFIR